MQSNFSNSLKKLPISGWKKYFPLLLGIFLFAGSAKAQLSGTYTICSSGCNYAKFSTAVADLNSQGISGPVIFNVSAGTYNDYFTLNSVTGASATNTITFKGAGKNSTKLTTGSTGNGPVYLNGSKYVIIDGMEISNT